MKRTELEAVIEEEIYKYLEEKSVPHPDYDPDKAERMTPAQIERRRELGTKWKEDPKKVAHFKRYAARRGKGDWIDWLWASASVAALGRGFKKKDSGSSDTSSDASKDDSSANKETPKTPETPKASKSKKTPKKSAAPKASKSKKAPKKSATPKASKDSKKTDDKKPRNKSDIKLTPAQKKNADAMYKQIQRAAKKDGRLDETRLREYASKLEQKFSMLSESHQNFDGDLMKKLLHKMVEKIATSGEHR